MSTREATLRGIFAACAAVVVLAAPLPAWGTMTLLLTVIFLLGLFWKRATEWGAIAAALSSVLLSWLGYGVLTAGAYVGGDLTYRSGNQVDRHAWRSAGKRWKGLDVTEVPEGALVRAMMGTEPLVLYRDGERINALHATCAHAGGPLDKGTLVDGCVECPWHGSRFRLADGHVARGPAVYDQPRYEVRAAEGGGFEARRIRADGAD